MKTQLALFLKMEELFKEMIRTAPPGLDNNLVAKAAMAAADLKFSIMNPEYDLEWFERNVPK